MQVQCPQCKESFDDARCWTVCPHNSLDVAHDAAYCRRHDLYTCYLCPEKLPAHMTQQEWDHQFFCQCRPIDPPPDHRPGFLMVGQVFKGDVEYKGQRYTVTAWKTGDKPYVDAKRHMPWSIQVRALDPALLPVELRPCAPVGSVRCSILTRCEAEAEVARLNVTPGLVLEAVELNEEQETQFQLMLASKSS